MTLGKWVKQIDIETLSTTTVALWLDEDREDILWEGRASKIPMEYLDYKIGITDDDPTVKPIMVFAKENQYGAYFPHFVITVTEPY